MVSLFEEHRLGSFVSREYVNVVHCTLVQHCATCVAEVC